MKRLCNHLIGINQGDTVLFSDFADDGEMWTGRGQRERRRHIAFSEPFRTEPVVHVSISMWDVDNETPMRVDVTADTITREGFDLVFRTWGGAPAWPACAWRGWPWVEVYQADEWDLY